MPEARINRLLSIGPAKRDLDNLRRRWNRLLRARLHTLTVAARKGLCTFSIPDAERESTYERRKPEVTIGQNAFRRDFDTLTFPDPTHGDEDSISLRLLEILGPRHIPKV